MIHRVSSPKQEEIEIRDVKFLTYLEARRLERGEDPYKDFGWRDITSEINVRGVGATDPSWAQIGSGPFYAYNFAVNDVCWMLFHMPHDYVPGTDMYFHAHWLADGTNTNSVKWQWEIMYARGYDREAFTPNSATTITAESTSSGQFYHIISETTPHTVNEAEVDGIIYCKISRITNGGTNNTDGIFLLTSDIHYRSTNWATQNRTPPFYP
jgi:hypothetical protein